MSSSEFFAPYTQEPVRIREYHAMSPLFYRDLSVMAGVFTADLETLRSMLPDRRLRPIRVSPGRGLVALHCFEYRESDIGPYNEVSLSIGVRAGKSWLPSAVGALDSFRSGHFHGFVRQLPVTTDVAVYGGLDYFNYPKYLSSISFQDEGSVHTCSLADAETGQSILTVRGKRFAQFQVRQPKVLTMHSYPQIEGEIEEAKVKLNLLESTMSFLQSDMSVHLGDHERSNDFHQLRMGRQLHYMVAPRCEAILFPPALSSREMQ